jgi:hypothetical protein
VVSVGIKLMVLAFLVAVMNSRWLGAAGLGGERARHSPNAPHLK